MIGPNNNNKKKLKQISLSQSKSDEYNVYNIRKNVFLKL
jgi:hypothetical protein